MESSQLAGIDHFQRSVLHLGGGVAVFDFDNDGWDDIYLTGGQNRDKLYRNNGDATFAEIGVEAGIGITAAVVTHGVTTADIDNDGFRDILVLTELGEENLLFRNNGNATFTRLVGVFDVSTTQRAISASFGDVNNDGLIDIYVVNYIHTPQVIYGNDFEVTGFAHQCDPDLLFINNGNLTFTESSAQYGLAQNGCGLASAFTDFDDDGDMDIFVINDFGQWVLPNLLYENQFPALVLEDVSAVLGIDARMYGMGVAIGDYDHDGDLDYYNTNIGPNYLFRNDGELFTEVGEISGVENDSLNGLNTTSWGCFFFDFDNDGWLDLFVANGEIPAANFIANIPDDPDKMFRNNGDGTFSDVTDAVGLGSIQRGRGTAFGDFNNDGLLDIVVNNVSNVQQGATALLYMNQTVNANHWLKVRVRGVQSNQDGYGSRIRIVADGIAQILELDGGSSHASQSTTVAHFGVGSATFVDSVMVTFPSGTVQIVLNQNSDQTILVNEDVVTGQSEPISSMVLISVGGDNYEVVESGNASFDISVIDMLGRTVYSRPEHQGAFQMPEFLKGLYVLRFTNSRHSYSIKIVRP